MRNGSLWSAIVFEKEVIFHEFDFENSDLEFEVSKSSIYESTQLRVTNVFFSFIIISQLRRPIIELKFSQVCIFMRWDTLSEKTGLWQLPIVYTVFNWPNIKHALKKLPKSVITDQNWSRFQVWKSQIRVVPNSKFEKARSELCRTQGLKKPDQNWAGFQVWKSQIFFWVMARNLCQNFPENIRRKF